MDIVSPQPNRFRFRNGALKLGSMGYALRNSLLELRGVISVEINKRVGSLLVMFDQSMISVQVILKKVRDILGLNSDNKMLKAMDKKINRRGPRSLVKKSLMVAGAVTLGSLAFSKKVHVVAGACVVGAATLHALQNRRTLLR